MEMYALFSHLDEDGAAAVSNHWSIIITVICIKFAAHRTFLFKNALTSILGTRHSTFCAVQN